MTITALKKLQKKSNKNVINENYSKLVHPYSPAVKHGTELSILLWFWGTTLALRCRFSHASCSQNSPKSLLFLYILFFLSLLLYYHTLSPHYPFFFFFIHFSVSCKRTFTGNYHSHYYLFLVIRLYIVIFWFLRFSFWFNFHFRVYYWTVLIRLDRSRFPR